MASFKGTGKKTLSINPYTGKVNGWTKSYPFFRTMRQLHRWLMDVPAQKGEKTVGKYVVGISTLLMAVILISGIVIWVPRSRKALRNRLTVSCSKGWRRFWYDSHVSLGFYATIFLLLMALTGLTWSFSWYRTAAYGLFGVSTSPSSGGAVSSHQPTEKKKEKTAFDYTTWDTAVAEIRQQYPVYSSLKLSNKHIQVNLPGNMRRTDTVHFNLKTGHIEEISLHTDTPVSQKIKGWFYAFHTGLWGGMYTKILYFLAALIGGILPLTGYYLWIKKKMARARKTS